MIHDEAKLAWRLFSLNWVLNGVFGLALALGLLLTGFSLKIDGVLFTLGLVVLFSAVAYAYVLTQRHTSRVPFILGSMAQLGLLLLLVRPVIYIFAAADLPMQDANLDHLDRMLGLDWHAYFSFVSDRPALIPYVTFCYLMIGWPVFGIPIILGSSRRYRRLQQFILAWTMTLMVATVISPFLPAMGTYHHYGLSLDFEKFNLSNYSVQVRDLPLLREGLLRTLESGALGGIVTFPSCHAAASVLYLWAFWSIWWMRPIALIMNVGMLLATPIGGGHYFVDVFAGVGIAVLAIAAVRRIEQWLAAGERPSIKTTDVVGPAVAAER